LKPTWLFEEQVKFEGTLSMPTNKILLLRKSYDLPTYIEALGDEELAFRKAFQALLNSSDHASLDMGGASHCGDKTHRHAGGSTKPNEFCHTADDP
jgi:hypothetical protein